MKAKKETEKMNERETTVQVCIVSVYTSYAIQYGLVQSYKEAFERIQEATGIIASYFFVYVKCPWQKYFVQNK